MESLANSKSNDAMLDPKDALTSRTEEDMFETAGESSTHAQFAEGEEGQHGVASSKKRRRPWTRKRDSYSANHFRVYKRRWFGLAQLVLLNIIASWDWLTFAPVSTKSAAYFNTSETSINWLATGFLFANVVSCPIVIYTLHKGPKPTMLSASVLLLVGNWIRYAGTQANGGIYGLVMFGQILTGMAQTFVLATPTRYSDMWFTERGRVGATAVASLANPLGGALAQLINPAFDSVPDMILIISIIATVACIPSLFIPASPPTPPTASSGLSRTPLLSSFGHMLRSPPSYVVLITFGTYVGLFNSFASLLNQILYPYGYSEDEAGICGAVMIVVGLVTAAILSPILDRTHAYILSIRILCPLVALSYLAFIWAPQTRTIEAPYILGGILGAASFSLLPCALEYLVEITYPASPEISSALCWAMGQLLGGVFVIVQNALKDGRSVDLKQVREDGRGAGGGDKPPGNMYNALVFQGVIAMAVLPLPLMLGVKRLGMAHGEGRLQVDEHRIAAERGVVEGTA